MTEAAERLREIVESRQKLREAVVALEQANEKLKKSEVYQEAAAAKVSVKLATAYLDDLLDETVTLMQYSLLQTVDRRTGEVMEEAAG